MYTRNLYTHLTIIMYRWPKTWVPTRNNTYTYYYYVPTCTRIFTRTKAPIQAQSYNLLLELPTCQACNQLLILGRPHQISYISTHWFLFIYINRGTRKKKNLSIYLIHLYLSVYLYLSKTDLFVYPECADKHPQTSTHAYTHVDFYLYRQDTRTLAVELLIYRDTSI